MVRKALIPAAGLGTRFLPATKVVPKELLPVLSRPALEWVVEEIADSGVEEIVLVVSPGKTHIAEHFSRGGSTEEQVREKGKLHLLDPLHSLLRRVKFTTVYQERALGLGHAVLCGRAAVGREPFAVVLPDDLVRSKTPCVRQLAEVHRETGDSVVAVEKVPKRDVSRYGIVAGPKLRGIPGAIRVDRIIEKPAPESAPSRWAVIGRYILGPEIFDYLERTRPGALGEIQLTDALAMAARKKSLVAFPFEGERLDTGQPEGFLSANLVFAAADPRWKKALAPVVRRLFRAGR